MQKPKLQLSIPVIIDPSHDINIPNKIHLIWLGSILPDKYLKHIYDLIALRLEDKFEVNIWVDKESNFYSAVRGSKQTKDFSLTVDALEKITHVRNIREIEVLFEKFFHSSDSVKSKLDMPTIQQLLLIAEKERIGTFCNYAAASDIYRYLILYALGGFYMDVDDKVNFPFIKKTKKKLTIDPEYKPRFGFLYHNNRGIMNNDLLLSAKYHPILEDMLIKIAEGYRIRDKQNLFTIKDTKRSEFRTRADGLIYDSNHNRFNLTLQLTGPDLLYDSLDKYKVKHNIINNRPIMFDPEHILPECDTNWLKAKPNQPTTDENLYLNNISSKKR